jgi:hypothetical protein
MPNWAAGRRGDILVRLSGLVLILLSVTSIRMLAHLHPMESRFDPGVIEFALAAAGFLSGSTGLGLAAIGHHVFDEVEISERWRSRPTPRQERRKASITQYSEMPAEDTRLPHRTG